MLVLFRCRGIEGNHTVNHKTAPLSLSLYITNYKLLLTRVCNSDLHIWPGFMYGSPELPLGLNPFPDGGEKFGLVVLVHGGVVPIR